MKKNGFTLAELLGVMVILSLISIITIPAVTDALKQYRVNLCESQVKEIVSAARAWGSDNILILPTDDEATYTIDLETLATYGYIDNEIKNPITKENFNTTTTKVEIKRVGKKYTYSIIPNNLCE